MKKHWGDMKKFGGRGGGQNRSIYTTVEYCKLFTGSGVARTGDRLQPFGVLESFKVFPEFCAC